MKTRSDNVSKVELHLPTKDDANQSREVSMFLKSSDFDRVPNELNPFAKMASNPCGGAHSTGPKA